MIELKAKNNYIYTTENIDVQVTDISAPDNIDLSNWKMKKYTIDNTKQEINNEMILKETDIKCVDNCNCGDNCNCDGNCSCGCCDDTDIKPIFNL